MEEESTVVKVSVVSVSSESGNERKEGDRISSRAHLTAEELLHNAIPRINAL